MGLGAQVGGKRSREESLTKLIRLAIATLAVLSNMVRNAFNLAKLPVNSLLHPPNTRHRVSLVLQKTFGSVYPPVSLQSGADAHCFMYHPLFLIGSFGTTEMLLILFVIILLFGAKRIPELFRGMGQGVREFKDASKPEEPQYRDQPVAPPVQPPYQQYPPQGYPQPGPGYPQQPYQQPGAPQQGYQQPTPPAYNPNNPNDPNYQPRH